MTWRRDDFGRRLSEALDRYPGSAAELARAVGVTDGMVSGYRSGRSWPGIDALRSLALTLHVSADWLLGLSDDPNPSQRPPVDLDKVREEVSTETVDIALELFERRFLHAIDVLPPDVRRRVRKRLREDPEAHTDEETTGKKSG